MRKILCAALALFLCVPASATTAIHLKATGTGTKITTTWPGNLPVSTVDVDLVLNAWINPDFNFCPVPTSCSLSGSNILFSTVPSQGSASLGFDHILGSVANTTSGFTGGTFSALFTDHVYIYGYSGSFTALSVETIEIPVQGFLGNWTWSATPTSSSQAVPEPASWAMMIAGLGLVGAALRTRPRVRFA